MYNVFICKLAKLSSTESLEKFYTYISRQSSEKCKDTHEDSCNDKGLVGHGVNLAEAAVALVLASQAQPVDAVPAADLRLETNVYFMTYEHFYEYIYIHYIYR